ncbi:metal ABC transporter permease [Sporolituus thermophilus]|uniref:Zinc transport system permease protein n=1 Tax=Sporolituus thermophilus DSM 23256 TaxID=1123285 RepID=A0A1G7IA48_9FIRM|nr:metal ABC transporter permease [Sporolituus thermophilus]SDF09473.1 zinc transport system permease protein [Sporolituus thermophilus DSM 23256]
MEFLQYDFMQRALAAGLITAIVCPLIGMFVVIRRQSLIGDGLGHIAFAGVTGGYLLGVNPFVAAALLTVAGAVGIEIVRRWHSQFADMVLAIFFYAGIAMAIIFSTMTRMSGAGLLSFLFGSIMTVTTIDLMLIAFCGAVVVAVIYRYFDKLMLLVLDEEVAIVSGINTGAINMLFSVLTALVVVIGMTVVGILLVSALMIVPVAAALLLRRGFKVTLAWALIFSILSVTGGLILAFYLDIAPGGTIVITTIGLYLLVLFWRRDLLFLGSLAAFRHQSGD